MAKQTLKSLLGSSDEREQVELNLNPVALQPTIRNGGNYRVAVQDTPKTNSALQLSEALKAGVQVYGQGVKIAQDKAKTDVETMSEEDFDKFLTEGLDEESRSIFGYTKAYNQALAKKYYAEEMPTKLQAIAAELHKDPYKYKDPAQFEGAAIAAVNEAYDEADELLGGNVFSERANNALKSATKSDFVAKQQATYIQKMPEITRQNASEGAFNAFSKITKADTEAKAMIDAQINSATEAVGNRKEAAAIVTKAYLDNIEALAKQEGQEGLAQALLDELHSGEDEKKAGLQGRRQFGDDKLALFNTAENRGRIEDLEDDIENAGVSGYNAHIARAREAQAGLELEAFGKIAEANGDETTALARFEEIEADIRNGSVTINGVTYTDTIELNEIRKFIAGARSNKDLFVYNAKLNFVQQNREGKRAAVNALTTQGALASINAEAAAKLVSVKPNPVTGAMDVVYTPEGATFLTDFNREVEQLELQLADTLLGDTSLSVGERITEYSKLYPAEVTGKMQDWISTRLANVVPLTGTDSVTVSAQRNKDAVDFLDEKTRAKIKASAQDVEEENELLDVYIEEAKAEAKAKNEYVAFQTKQSNQFVDNKDKPNMESAVDEDGNRILRSDVGYGTTPKLLETSYDRATKNNLFRDTEERIAGHKQLVTGWENQEDSEYQGISFKDRAYAQYIAEGYFFKDTPIEKAAKRKKMVGHYKRYGVDIAEVITDEAKFKGFTRTRHSVTISEMFGGEDRVDFRLFPITVYGSVETVALTVSDYFKAKEAGNLEGFGAGNFARVAEKYFNGNLDALMTAQRTYLLQHKFITK